MAYHKGSLGMNPWRDIPLLRQILHSTVLSHSQLFQFMSLGHYESRRDVFNWRLRRLVKHGMVNRHVICSVCADHLYTITNLGAICLERHGDFYLPISPVVQNENKVEALHLLHYLELNEIHLALGGDASNTKVLLREGDLWTKGGSTGKRLATPEDWDEIYEEKIEREVEKRTKIRTAHLLEQAIAQERIRSGYGLTGLPTYATDEEFLVLIEQLCATKDVDRFKLLLERLRDEVVEAWHEIKAYDDMPQEQLQSPEESIPQWVEVVKNHKQNVFLPAMQRVTMTGILVVKNAGPTSFLDLIVSLLREVYEVSHRLKAMQTLRDVLIRFQKKQLSSFNEHMSDTVPALESLVSLHIIGAYICKRNRYEYISLLLRPDVVAKRPYLDNCSRKSVMAFWPLVEGCGEPQELGRRAGRINLCVGRMLAEHAYSRMFGSETVALESLIQYEFLLKLNSYLAIHSQEAPRPMDFMAHRYEGILFEFWDSLIAFHLEPISNLALMLYKEIKEKKSDLLKQVLFDPELAVFLKTEDANEVFKDFLQTLCKNQSELFLEQNRFPPELYWPEELKTLLS